MIPIPYNPVCFFTRTVLEGLTLQNPVFDICVCVCVFLSAYWLIL